VPVDAGIVSPVVTKPGMPLGVVDPGPETPDVTPATVFADVTPPPEPEGLGTETAPEAPTAPAGAPEEPVAESPAAAES